MQVEFTQNNQETVIKVIGKISYEGAAPLRRRMENISNIPRFVLDLSGADFVGSTNIGTFFLAMRDLGRQSQHQRLVIKGASRDFIRLFALYDGEQASFDVLETSSLRVDN